MWYAYYNKKTLDVVSTSDELNEKLPPDIAVVEIGDDWVEYTETGVQEWDKDQLAYIEKPWPQRKTKEEQLNEISLDLNLTAEQIQKLEKFL